MLESELMVSQQPIQTLSKNNNCSRMKFDCENKLIPLIEVRIKPLTSDLDNFQKRINAQPNTWRYDIGKDSPKIETNIQVLQSSPRSNIRFNSTKSSTGDSARDIQHQIYQFTISSGQWTICPQKTILISKEDSSFIKNQKTSNEVVEMTSHQTGNVI